MSTNSSILVFNSLIDLNNDRIAGYKIASEATNDFELKNMFEGFINTSKRCKQQLLIELYKIGAVVKDSNIIKGNFYNIWMDFKSAFNFDPKILLTTCELTDAAALNSYNKILTRNEKDISLIHYTIINIQHTYLRVDYDKIKNTSQKYLLE